MALLHTTRTKENVLGRKTREGRVNLASFSSRRKHEIRVNQGT
jgi:hypothetical protein